MASQTTSSATNGHVDESKLNVKIAIGKPLLLS